MRKEKKRKKENMNDEKLQQSISCYIILALADALLKRLPHLEIYVLHN